MKAIPALLGLGLIGFIANPVSAQLTSDETLLHRDRAYEETLRLEASADNKITPIRVIRWICSMTGHAITSAPSAAEFQPILNVNDGRVRIIAAIKYKF